MKLKGLRQACTDTRVNCVPGKLWIQLSVDMQDGMIYTDLHTDSNSWTQYHDKTMLTFLFTDKPLTMVDIKTACDRAIYNWNLN